MSLYIKTRCPICDSIGNYANDIKDTITCDNCVSTFNKMDGILLAEAPKNNKVRNELRKKNVYR